MLKVSRSTLIYLTFIIVLSQLHDPTRSLNQPVEHVVVEKLGRCADDFARMSCCCLL